MGSGASKKAEAKLQVRDENPGETLDMQFQSMTNGDLENKLQQLHTTFRCAKLMCNFNQISHMPPLSQYTSFKALKWLWLANNKIEAVEENTIPVTVEWLDLRNNKIKQFPNLSKHKTELLWLGNNAITVIDPKCLPVTITELDLRANKLKTIPNLTHLTKLEELDASGNKITELSIILLPTGIKEIHLQNNSLIHVDNLSRLTKLKKLGLHNNHIKVLAGLPGEMEDVALANNPLEHLLPGCFPNEEAYSVILKEPVGGTELFPMKEKQLSKKQIEKLQSPPAEVFWAGYPTLRNYFENA